MRCGRGPVVDQVGGVNRTDAGSEVPTGSRSISWRERRIRSGKNADGTVRKKTIGTGAIHIHVTHGHVVENAARANSIPII